MTEIDEDCKMLASQTDKHWSKGYISGAFDMFHIGHLNLIKRAKNRCDHLIIGVLSDEVIASQKHKWPVIPLAERMEIIRALKYVDEVDVTTQGLLNKIIAWNKYKFDAMFSGDDHIDDGWASEEEELKILGADIVFFPYTREVSTTFLQELTLPKKAVDADKPARVGDFSHIFPFNKVSKDERIVIYGTGDIGLQYYRQLTALDYCEIVAFCDSYAKPGDKFQNVECIQPQELLRKSIKFDKIVVATTTHHDEILNRLRSLDIHPEMIV